MTRTMDRFSLSGKTVVITGGAGLLGKRHAIAVIDAGATAVLLDLNSDALKRAESEILKATGAKPDRLLSIPTDITLEAQVTQAAQTIAKKFGRPADVLINNAAIDPKFDSSPGAAPPSRLEGFSIERWNLELGVGLTGSLICSKIFGTEMAKRGSGVILNIASDLGIIAPDQRLYRKPGLSDEMQNVKPVTYSVIKHGLIGLTRYLATYWADHGVRCNAFAPGGVFNQHPDEFVQNISKLIPMGRMAQIDEYQAPIVFLCSDASSYMNGAVLTCDGGRSVW